MTVFNAPYFKDADKAREFLETLRWSDGVICPHCGVFGTAYKRSKPGLWRCASKPCRKDFTVTTKSVMESSHIKLNVWLQAFHLMASSKKGMSAHQLHRMLGVTYKSAWFMAHRIREAMRSGGLMPPLGGAGGIVEADETYFGPVATPKPRSKRLPPPTKGGRVGPGQKRAIVALVERGGEVRSFHVPHANKETVVRIVSENVHHESELYTDESRLYSGADRRFAAHETVKHSASEYVRYEGERKIHTNTIEGVFSIFKRGMKGVYQHCAEKHLHRYLAEFDFRYNNRVALGVDDGERAARAIRGGEHKRLTYRQPD